MLIFVLFNLEKSVMEKVNEKVASIFEFKFDFVFSLEKESVHFSNFIPIFLTPFVAIGVF